MRHVTDIIGREQEQWFLWLPVAFGGGIALYFKWPHEPEGTGAMLVALAAVLAYVGARSKGLWILLVGSVAALATGFAAAKVRTWAVEAPILDRARGPLTVKGFIELIEPRARGGARVTVRVASLDLLSAARTPSSPPYRVRVRLRQTVPDLQPGQAVTFRAYLSPPSPPAYPGDFDFGRQAYFTKLGAVGFAITPPRVTADIGPPPRSMMMTLAIERLRQAIAERILARVPGETGHIVLALITGERGGISDATNQAWRDAGLFHILSISGLHMVVLAGSLYWVVRLALALWPPLALRYRIKKWAAASAILGALAYLLISGGAFATIRSWVMITIIFGAIMVDRPALALRNVALAALIILALWPESLLDAGFQMSFAAVVALISGFEWVHARTKENPADVGKPSPVRQATKFVAAIVLSTLIASFAVAPFSAYHFHTSQQYALLANIVAIPLCNLIVMPAALAVFIALPFGLEALPLWIMAQTIDAISVVARATAQLPGATIRIPAISEKAFLLMVVGGLWLLLWHTPWRLGGAIAIGSGLALTPWSSRPLALIAAEGTLIAVRGADGQLSALAARAQSFTLQRWLDADGDARPRDNVADARGYACDGEGCLASLPHPSGPQALAISRAPSSLIDDCAKPQILIMLYERPKPCWLPQMVIIDARDLRAKGTHAIFAGPQSWLGWRLWALAGGPMQPPSTSNPLFMLTTVEDTRGVRPWTQRGQRSLARRDRDRDGRYLRAFEQRGARLGGFAGLSPRFDEETEAVDDREP